MKLKTYPKLVHGNLLDFSQGVSPETFKAWDGERLQLPNEGTHFGFVYTGNAILYRNAGMQEYRVHPGMYFRLPGDGWIGGENSSGFVVTCPNYSGTFLIGGPIESTGRMGYINGGTDSVIIPPIRLGDPCLNALYFPTKTDQTAHTHPSYRMVMVIEGSGECETPEGTIPLEPGIALFIPTNYLHKFRTNEHKLTAICFHPDSDTGFTDDDHPMLKRTIVEGMSASQIPEIQTMILSNKPQI
ncbi:cupin domain-containing protein [Floridanema evergladense]|uniref:Cupin domain-containing protein n=1 Tax=Floridaenema evergladense BLCC-F167 TaxID=3153639 RepID=A0ABV4WSI2_9CYAN